MRLLKSDVVPGSPTLKQGRANRGYMCKRPAAHQLPGIDSPLLSIFSQRIPAVRNPLEGGRCYTPYMFANSAKPLSIILSPSRSSRVSSPACSQPRSERCHRVDRRRRVSKSRKAAEMCHPTQSTRQELPSHARTYYRLVLACAESRRQEKGKRAKKSKTGR